MLGWLEHLWLRRTRSGKPLCGDSRAGYPVRLRKLFDLPADHAIPPRPPTPEDDLRLQTELRRRNDLLSNALLPTRPTGMRIGETVDLAPIAFAIPAAKIGLFMCLAGKLHNERRTPVHHEVRSVIARLQFVATPPPWLDSRFCRPGHAAARSLV